MHQKQMYVIIAVLTALVAALAGSLMAVADGERPLVALKTAVGTFAGALTLMLAVMACLGVVGQ